MDWKSYEDVVRYIYEQLGKASRVRVVCGGSNCKIKGKSGVEHQIDVLTEHSDGLHAYRTAIECKYWADKVQKEAVTKLAEILEDAQIEKGVIVSKTGFTPDAVSFAKYKNISIVELREPTDDDWKGRVKDICITLHIEVPHVTDVEIVQPSANQGTPLKITALSSDVILETQQGHQSLHKLIDGELRNGQSKGADASHREVRLSEGAVLRVEGESFSAPVQAVRFKVTTTRHEHKIEIRGADYVSMIMHSIFEGKRFIIDKSGQIRASEP